MTKWPYALEDHVHAVPPMMYAETACKINEIDTQTKVEVKRDSLEVCGRYPRINCENCEKTTIDYKKLRTIQTVSKRNLTQIY